MVRVTDERKKIIRMSILDVAQKHFLEKGYDDTKTKDIASEVGIAEGTLFNYFPTKTEIFLEAMAEGYIVDINAISSVDYKKEIVDIVYDLIYTTMKAFVKVPRKIIKEIMAASVNLAKNKPALMKKIIQLDYNMIQDLEDITKRLIDEGRLEPAEPKMYSEILYSVVVVEMMLYVYEEKITLEKMLENLREKIRFTLEGHIL